MLVGTLVGREFNPREEATEGIDIVRWQVSADGGGEVRLKVWDFGGQEIMHATHQFFLTRRSLYVLVVDALVGAEDNRVEYWLKIIQSFGKEAPVLVVGNKIDRQSADGPEASRRRFLELVRSHFEAIHRTLPGIRAVEDAPPDAPPEPAVDYKRLLLDIKHVAERVPERLESVVNLRWFLDRIEAERARRKGRRDTAARADRFPFYFYED